MATAFIPAKGTSVRIPKKNVIDLGGAPLISWTLRACESWDFIDKVVVATEDVAIAEIARRFGASIYPLESKDVRDNRTVSQLWKEFVGDQSGPQVLMHCTNPFHKISEMERASTWFSSSDADILISVRDVCHCVLNDKGKLSPEDVSGRMSVLSQDRLPKYILDGSYYISSCEYVRQCDYFEQGEVLPFVVSPMSSIEINTQEDLELCRAVASCGIDEWFEKYGS